MNSPTFAHRNPDNVPFSPGLGHARFGEDPDSTFDITNQGSLVFPAFLFNDEKAIAMESRVFSSLKNNFGLSAYDAFNAFGPPLVFENIRQTLLEFNVIPFRGDDPIKWGILDSKLQELGLGGIPPYDVNFARGRRNANLGSLNPQNYPGAILRTPVN